jgi:hypothetical protein
MWPLRLAIIIGVLYAPPLAFAQQQSLPYPWNQLSPGAQTAAMQCEATHSPWQAVERCILITLYNNPNTQR